jgi:putative hydrolase of the HAD superfamily
MPVRAITFDFWMTLFREQDRDLRHEYRAKAFCRATGAPLTDVSRALQLAHDHFFHVHVTEQRTLDPLDAVNMVCTAMDIVLAKDVARELAEIFGTAIHVYPPALIEGALDAVKAAAARCPIGIISDSGMSPGASLRKLLDDNGFTPHFTTTTFSDELGVAKPQAAMFERTAAALGVAPSELLHIGDLDPTDIAGVQAVGGIGALFAGANARFAENTSAEYVFHHWSEFLEALPEIR